MFIYVTFILGIVQKTLSEVTFAMKFRILGIAPYEALKNNMLRLAEARNDMDLDAYVGDLDTGVRIMQDHAGEAYDAIISRGGTAEAISRVSSVPVVDISLSVYDILRSIRLAENYKEPYAVVGFPNITEAAHLLCDLLQYRLQIVTIHNEGEASSALTSLQEQGCSMVICDMVTQSTARQRNMNAILITSGAESILSAFNQAVKICRSYYSIREENNFLHSILQDSSSYTIVMSEDGSIFLSTWDQGNEDEVYEVLRGRLSHILTSDDRKFFHTIDRTLYSVSSRISSYKEKKYVIFYFTASKIPLNAGKYGIHYCNKEEVEEEYFNSFFSITGAMGNLSDKIESIAAGSYPVMITSEESTGKEPIAGMIYRKSELSTNPFISIDCSMLNDRNWEFLLNHYNSPFNDNDNTLYFQNLETLTPAQHKVLLNAILDTHLHKRNRLIFSTVGSRDKEISDYLMEYEKRLACVTVSLSPLRTRRDEIAPLANLYLSRLNVELGKQLLGFEPQAIQILEDYDWPLNYSQFRRVLTEAASMTDSAYIRSDTVAGLIAGEQAAGAYHMFYDSAADRKLPGLTLDEITKSIVEKVLKDNNGNQSKTASQLGISRTTLWRYVGKKT